MFSSSTRVNLSVTEWRKSIRGGPQIIIIVIISNIINNNIVVIAITTIIIILKLLSKEGKHQRETGNYLLFLSPHLRSPLFSSQNHWRLTPSYCDEKSDYDYNKFAVVFSDYRKPAIVDAYLNWFIEDSLARISYSVERPLQVAPPIFMDGWYIEHCTTRLCPARETGQWPFLHMQMIIIYGEQYALTNRWNVGFQWNYPLVQRPGLHGHLIGSRSRPVMDWTDQPKSSREEEGSKSSLMKSTLFATQTILTLVSSLRWWRWLLGNMSKCKRQPKRVLHKAYFCKSDFYDTADGSNGGTNLDSLPIPRLRAKLKCRSPQHHRIKKLQDMAHMWKICFYKPQQIPQVKEGSLETFYKAGDESRPPQ